MPQRKAWNRQRPTGLKIRQALADDGNAGGICPYRYQDTPPAFADTGMRLREYGKELVESGEAD